MNIKKSIDRCFNNMYSDLENGRDIDAIISGYGFTFIDEHKEAKEYFLKKVKKEKSRIDEAIHDERQNEK